MTPDTFNAVAHQVALMSPEMQLSAPAARAKWASTVDAIAGQRFSGDKTAKMKIQQLDELVRAMPDVAVELAAAWTAHVDAIIEGHIAAMKAEVERLEARRRLELG